MKVTLRSRQTAYIHTTELVWPRRVTLRSWCDCTLYSVQCTVKFIWLADFVFLLYIAQSRQSARLFLQSSELAPQPQEMVSPLLWFKGGTHSLAGEGFTLLSWCDSVKWPYGVKKIRTKWLWPVKVTLKVIKRHLFVFCWSCDVVPLKWNKKNCRASSLSLRIDWA